MATKKKSDGSRLSLFAEDGTPFDEAASSLIKHLRRGETARALYWAKQLSERYPHYVWRRLAIFAAEDVSIANPLAIQNVVGMWSVDEQRAWNGQADAVIMLSESPKCRESNYLWGALTELKRIPDHGVPIPEFGEDVDLWADALEKALMEGWEVQSVWFARGLHAQPRSWTILWDVVRRMAVIKSLSDPMLLPTVEALFTAYVRIVKANKDRPDLDVVSMACLMVSRASLLERNDERRLAASEKFEVAEYALDGHTQRGRQLHRDPGERHRRWFTEWSKVENNVGPNDWELWHLRRIAEGGMIDKAETEELAQKWLAEGRLVYGLEMPVPVAGWTRSKK